MGLGHLDWAFIAAACASAVVIAFALAWIEATPKRRHWD